MLAVAHDRWTQPYPMGDTLSDRCRRLIMVNDGWNAAVAYFCCQVLKGRIDADVAERVIGTDNSPLECYRRMENELRERLGGAR